MSRVVRNFKSLLNEAYQDIIPSRQSNEPLEQDAQIKWLDSIPELDDFLQTVFNTNYSDSINSNPTNDGRDRSPNAIVKGQIVNAIAFCLGLERHLHTDGQYLFDSFNRKPFSRKDFALHIKTLKALNGRIAKQIGSSDELTARQNNARQQYYLSYLYRALELELQTSQNGQINQDTINTLTNIKQAITELPVMKQSRGQLLLLNTDYIDQPEREIFFELYDEFVTAMLGQVKSYLLAHSNQTTHKTIKQHMKELTGLSYLNGWAFSSDDNHFDVFDRYLDNGFKLSDAKEDGSNPETQLYQQTTTMLHTISQLVVRKNLSLQDKFQFMCDNFFAMQIEYAAFQTQVVLPKLQTAISTTLQSSAWALSKFAHQGSKRSSFWTGISQEQVEQAKSLQTQYNALAADFATQPDDFNQRVEAFMQQLDRAVANKTHANFALRALQKVVRLFARINSFNTCCKQIESSLRTYAAKHSQYTNAEGQATQGLNSAVALSNAFKALDEQRANQAQASAVAKLGDVEDADAANGIPSAVPQTVQVAT